MASSRRTFLQQASVAAGFTALSHLSARKLAAYDRRALVPDFDEAQLRELAKLAVDAARSAGAGFADVRLGAGQNMAIISGILRGGGPLSGPPDFRYRAECGIRVLVDGAWGFAATQTMTPDALAKAAQAAVRRARAFRPRRPRHVELAPVPSVSDGRWAAPMEHDPFSVTLGDQIDRQFAALATMTAIPEVEEATVNFGWHRAARVFASTEGTCVLQRTIFSNTVGVVRATASGHEMTGSRTVRGLDPGPYGYEVVTRMDLAKGLREAALGAIEDSKQPMPVFKPVEPGRYDLVLDWRAVGRLVTTTLAAALNVERVLGYRANREGTSFAAPPADMLNKYRIGSPLLTLRADRTRLQGASTAKWDDEGAPTENFPLVKEGRIVDYLTNRQGAAELGAAYQAQGMPARSRGCASGFGVERPTVQLPNLTLEPGRAGTTVDDLIRDTKLGLYILRLWGEPDQQLLNAQYTNGGIVYAIRNGKLAEPIGDVGVQFITTDLWKRMDALGGPATMQTDLYDTDTQGTLQFSFASVSTVPARFRQVNVLNRGRTA